MLTKINDSRTRTPLKILLYFILLSVLMLTMFIGAAKTAHADGADNGFVLSTDYPEQKVQSGSDTTFTMTVKNTSAEAQSVDLTVAKIPDGWTYVMYGGGNEVYKTFVPVGDFERVNLVVTIPATAAEGQYDLVVNGVNDKKLESALTIRVNVTPVNPEEGLWDSKYTDIKGSNTDTFQFSTTLYNKSSVDQAYSLSSDAQPGWIVKFLPTGSDDQEIVSCSVPKAGSQGINIKITPAYSVTPGDYTIKFSAVSAQATLNISLKIQITGAYSIMLTTPTGALNAEAYPGQQTAVTLLVKNTGDSDISNIKLSGQGDSGWKIAFDSNTIDSLAVGGSKEVRAYITAPSDQIIGDYGVNFKASSSGASATSIIRVAVKTSTMWGFIGIIVILLLIAGLMAVFSKFGRR
jgi:uncharacterized membrane protein